MEKVFVKSFGCSANFAEGEMIRGQFAELAESEKDADRIVLNICTVKGDKNALDEIKKIKNKFPDKKLTITGCITSSIIEPIKKISDANLISTHHITNILPIINSDVLTPAKPIKLLMPRVRTNPVIGIVPISSGCLDACSFCSTRLVKGVLFSFPPEIIEQEVRKCVEDGCKEIWITGQDTCCYGFDRKTNLAQLIKRLVEIPGKFMIRIGMGNPRHLPKYLNEFVEIMKHPKVFKFIHIPFQAGNNNVLKAMRRGHTVEQIREIVQLLRKEIPNITISTDIIVGHPTETDEQFHDTVKLVQELKIDNMNIARFVSRSGTASASMNEQVHGNIAKERSRILTKTYRELSLESNQKWIDWKGEVIVDQKKKEGVEARNFAYKTVFIREDLPLGAKVKVRIIDAQVFFLEGELTS